MKKHSKRQNEVLEGKPNRTQVHHGSTTQAGSNSGQGSLQLGKNANRQGSESNTGASYDNERGWVNEALRRKDIKVRKGQ